MTNTLQDSRPPRLAAVDFGRGLAVFCLVFIHTLWMYASVEVQAETWLGTIIHFIGKGTAAFLICMGISMMLSTRQTFANTVWRAFMVLGLAYLMNFLKFIVPIEVFGTMPEAFIEAYGWHSPLNGKQLWYLFLTGDILQMAGVALLFLAIIRKFVTNKYGVLVLAVGILAVSRETSGLRFGLGDDYLAELLFGGNYHVYFPVVPWMSYILFGMFIGMQINENRNEADAVFEKLLIPGVVTLVIGGGLCFYDFEYHFGNFFHVGPGGVIYMLGINLVLLWLIHKFLQLGFQGPIMNCLHYLSSRVTSVYIVQWVLVCWGMGIIGYQTLSLWQTVAIMPVMLALTLLVQWGLDASWLLLSQRRSQGRVATHSNG